MLIKTSAIALVLSGTFCFSSGAEAATRPLRVGERVSVAGHIARTQGLGRLDYRNVRGEVDRTTGAARFSVSAASGTARHGEVVFSKIGEHIVSIDLRTGRRPAVRAKAVTAAPSTVAMSTTSAPIPDVGGSAAATPAAASGVSLTASPNGYTYGASAQGHANMLAADPGGRWGYVPRSFSSSGRNGYRSLP